MLEMEQAVRDQLRAFAEGRLSLKDLYHWLMDNVIAQQLDITYPSVHAAMGSTMLYIYEYQDGWRTREEIRAYVADHLKATAQ